MISLAKLPSIPVTPCIPKAIAVVIVVAATLYKATAVEYEMNFDKRMANLLLPAMTADWILRPSNAPVTWMPAKTPIRKITKAL